MTWVTAFNNNTLAEQISRQPYCIQPLKGFAILVTCHVPIKFYDSGDIRICNSSHMSHAYQILWLWWYNTAFNDVMYGLLKVIMIVLTCFLLIAANFIFDVSFNIYGLG